MLDKDMVVFVEKHLEAKGVKVMTDTTLLGFSGEGLLQQVETDKGIIDVDMAILSIGVRPTVNLAQKANIEIGVTGGIKVDETMKTSNDDIYAAGDCVETTNLVTGKACYIPLGSTANKQGRVAANSICGIKDSFPGVVGSSVCKVFDFTVARTGLGIEQAKSAGFDPEYALAPAPDKAHFMETAKPLMLKLIADKKTRKLLGVQAVGLGVGDKRIDVAATGISMGITVDQLANIDLVYAPPYAPAVDNILTGANVLRNKLDGTMQGISSEEVKSKLDNKEDFILLDVRSPGELEMMKIEQAINIPLGKLRGNLNKLDKSKEVIAFCKISLRGYEAALILKNAGFNNVKVMDGGILMWPYKK
jgi:rhodanese-related sulfurtransferase